MKAVKNLRQPALFNIGALSAVLAVALLAQGCTSAQVRDSRKKRDTAVSKYGMYCDFVKSDSVLETEVELNVRMSDRCDAARPFSITSYNTATDVHGVLFCCSLDPEKAKARATVTPPPPGPAIGTAAGGPVKGAAQPSAPRPAAPAPSAPGAPAGSP